MSRAHTIIILTALCFCLNASVQAASTVFGVHAQSKVWSEIETGYLGKYNSIADMLGSGAVVRDWWSWPDIEPSSGNYIWTQPDAAANTAVKAGQKLIVCLCGAPAWANGNRDATWPAADINLWKSFVSAVVQRYKERGVVITWELWNEENSPMFFESGPTPSWPEKARDFAAKVLIPGYDAVKAADPSAKVALGGLSANWFSDQPGAQPYEHSRYFLQQILSVQDASSHMDYVGYHPYLDPSDYRQLTTAVAQMRSMMGAFGIGDKPIIATEWGALSRNPLGDEAQCNRFVQLAALIQKCSFNYACYHYVIDAEGQGYGLFDKLTSQGPSHSDWNKVAYAYSIFNGLLAGAVYDSDAVFTSAPADTVGYIFTKSGSRVTVVWSYSSAGSAAFKIAGNTTSVKLVRRSGQVAVETPISLTQDQTLSITVDDNPVFIVESVPVSIYDCTFGMNNRSVGAGYGLSTLGLRVRAYGTVSNLSGTSCDINDGSGLVHIDFASARIIGTYPVANGKFVTVSGRVSSTSPPTVICSSEDELQIN